MPQFPHYMWGYIAGQDAGSGRLYVPSLYVRVYRALRHNPRETVCSLIICEGISQDWPMRSRSAPFPHYMWGYIVRQFFTARQRLVPSLYVRVYRRNRKVCSWDGCSLIICEGISPDFRKCLMDRGFPHYMWGYIGLMPFYEPGLPVPSLYVRVYHIVRTPGQMRSCSLIICEGISIYHIWGIREWLFPHYMWGYIEGAVVDLSDVSVPSLHVSV